jgi:hypothetical protein
MMSLEKSISSPPLSPGLFIPPLRMCGLSRFRLTVALAVTIFFVLTSIITYRPPHRGLLLVSSDDAQTQLPERPIGYVVENSQEKLEVGHEHLNTALPALTAVLLGSDRSL